MDRDTENRNLAPRSSFRFPASLPGLWDAIEDRMSQFMGGTNNETGVEVSEDNQNVYIKAQLPGIDNPEISFHKNTVWIKGEAEQEQTKKDRKFHRHSRNSFFYQIDLPSQVEENSEEAHFENGVLELTFKKTQQSQVRKINVKNGKKSASKNGSSQQNQDKR